MRPLSSDSSSLLAALHEKRSFFARLLDGPHDEVAIFDRLAARAEPAMVPRLLFTLGEQGDAARAGARALAAAAAAATPDELLELDETCRGAWWYAQGNERHVIDAGSVARLAERIDDAARLIGVVSFHPDGHVRESAVACLAEMRSGDELPFLLIRLNDWVGEVARRAEHAVRQRMTPGNAARFVEYFPIILRLGVRRRRRHDAVVDGVLALLLAPESRAALLRGLLGSDRRARRTLFRAALAARTPDWAEHVERALADEDTVVRLHAARALRHELGGEAFGRLLPMLIRDPYPAIRSEAVAAAAESHVPNAHELLVQALVDRSRMVRETARFCLRGHASLGDFRSFYRARIAERSPDSAGTRTLAAAIAGLGETGVPEDLSVVEPLVTDPRPAVRIACARAMAMLDIDASLARIADMLRDPSPAVTRAVRRLIEPRAGAVGAELIRGMLAEIPHVHGRLDVSLLARRLGKWDAITVLLEHLRDPSAEVRECVALGVQHWLANRNASFAQPTRDQLRGLRAAVAARRLALDPSTAAELEAIVRYWEGSSPTPRPSDT